MSARENGALLELVSCRQEDKISGNPNNDCELWIGTTKLAGLVTTGRLACSDDISRIFRICAPARRGDAQKQDRRGAAKECSEGRSNRAGSRRQHHIPG